MRTLLLLALAALLVPAARADGGERVRAAYAVGALGPADAGCDDCVLRGLDVGGHRFPPHPLAGAPSRVDVADQGGGPVVYLVCQDWNGDGACGAGEPALRGCGTSVDLAASPVAFNPFEATYVVVQEADATHPAADLTCGPPPEGGVLTLTFGG